MFMNEKFVKEWNTMNQSNMQTIKYLFISWKTICKIRMVVQTGALEVNRRKGTLEIMLISFGSQRLNEIIVDSATYECDLNLNTRVLWHGNGECKRFERELEKMNIRIKTSLRIRGRTAVRWPYPFPPQAPIVMLNVFLHKYQRLELRLPYVPFVKYD